MEDPEDILRRIMEFERMCTPNLTNLIKQSLAEEVHGGNSLMEDYAEIDRYSQFPIRPTHSTVAGHSESPITPPPPSYRETTNHRLETSDMDRPSHRQNGHRPNGHIPNYNNNNQDDNIDTDRGAISFSSDYQVDYSSSDSDHSDDHHHTSSPSSEVEDPLVGQYKQVSFEIHRIKLKLRKLDRQITLAQRTQSNQSVLVKQHSDFKIKIASLISQRRDLESHDVVRQHLKEEEDDDAVEIDMSAMDELAEAMDLGLMEINEDQEEDEEDEEDIHEEEEEEDEEVKQNNPSHTNGSMGIEIDQDTLSQYIHSMGLADDHSHSEDDDEEPTGSVQLHSSDESGGSVQYHSSEDSNDSDGGGSMVINGDAEEWDTAEIGDSDESMGGGSVQLNDVEHTEEWVDEQFASKDMPFGDDDENESDRENDPVLETQPMDNHQDRRQNGNGQRRRHQEQMSEIAPFSVDDLVRGDSAEAQHEVDDRDLFAEMPFLNVDDSKELEEDDEEREEDDYKGLHIDNEDEFDIPDLPERRRKKSSVILDIGKLSQLAAVIEEENSEEDVEGVFEAVEYETDSDADSNDSVVVKKEIVLQVTSDELQQKIDSDDDEEEDGDDDESPESFVIQV